MSCRNDVKIQIEIIHEACNKIKNIEPSLKEKVDDLFINHINKLEVKENNCDKYGHLIKN